MNTVLIATAAFVGFIVAYHTYGRWLARRIFGLDPQAEVPCQQLRDNVDYVPAKREVIFGHHFTSIAGTGPIVGPAIAVFWGWLPALIWVVVGSIFIGAVHDFGALVVSLRNRGQTVGEIAGRIISPRARVLFLLILFFALTIVLAIFGLVIASIFKLYPESVLSVWIEIPIALVIGYWVHKRQGKLFWPSVIALGIMYLAIVVGVYWLPIQLPDQLFGGRWGEYTNPVVVWTALLFIYCFFASTLPVWALLQPRDFINSHQLVLALGLLVLGLFVAGLSGSADLLSSTPAVVDAASIPKDAPPIWPFLFITIACGAVSGFHCLVSSGTSSKQLACEPDAQYVGYGAMLLEGALAVIVILACCAGVGMGKFDRQPTPTGYDYVAATNDQGQVISGIDAWKTRYSAEKGWGAFGLGAKVGAFIEGGANFLTSLGIPLRLAIGIIAVLVASFAATTLDTATRLQRYVIQELGHTLHLEPITNKYVATALALLIGGAMAVIRANPDAAPGTGGLILWPLFGATNQLLAGLAFMVVVFYLWRRQKPIWFAVIPMILMVIMPVWALCWNLFSDSGWLAQGKYLLLTIGLAVLALQTWMIVEAILIWPKARGVLEEALPPLKRKDSLASEGGR